MYYLDEKFGTRIKEMREYLGKKMTEMAKELKLEKSSLSRYENNKNTPSVEFLYRLLKIYNININWLLSGFGEMVNSSDEYLSKKQATITSFDNLGKLAHMIENLNEKDKKSLLDMENLNDNESMIPISGEIAAGEPVEVRNDRSLGYTYIPTSLKRNAPKDLFAFRVNGKSMQPDINHSDLVFIKKNNDWTYLNKKIVAIRVNGEITLKKLQLDNDNGLILLLAFNPDYQTIIVHPDETEDIELIGELKSIIRSY